MAILLVEDDPVLADVLRTGVAGVGLYPVVARTLAEADLVLETVEVAAIAVDVGVEGDAALEWLEHLAILHPPYANRAIAIFDRLPGDDVRARLKVSGAGVLLKPFTIHDFEEALRERLEAPAPPAPARRPVRAPGSHPDPSDA